MPSYPYTGYVTDLTAQALQIVGGWGDAQTVLGANSAPDTAFLEIGYQGGKIVRLWDGIQVTSLPASEQERLFPQLAGLFKLAINSVLLP